MNHRYRDGGGLGHRRDINARPKKAEVTVSVIDGEAKVRRRPIADMSLGQIAQEVEELQGRKDRGDYLPNELFRRLLDLKGAYRKMVKV